MEFFIKTFFANKEKIHKIDELEKLSCWNASKQVFMVVASEHFHPLWTLRCSAFNQLNQLLLCLLEFSINLIEKRTRFSCNFYEMHMKMENREEEPPPVDLSMFVVISCN